MSEKMFTVSIIGCGARGKDVYGSYMKKSPERYKIVALCDINRERLEMGKNDFGVGEENCFTDEDEFFKEKRSDILVIATQDKDHVRNCLKALRCGYDILMEKPITDDREECKKILEAQEKYGGKVLICHVLRYAPAFLKAAELIDSGKIGRLVAINSVEQVAYWHQAHSYVRGNWRRSEETTPMILAKCCNDLDLLQFYAKSPCKSISSVGDLTYFTEENAPEGAAERCTECKYIDTCPYSAKRLYVERWKNTPNMLWPCTAITNERPLSEEVLTKAIKEGRFGRCVYHCDNNVVDHELTTMTFENGVKATLTMTAFTHTGGRIMTFYGTLGEVDLCEHENYIKLKQFGKEIETWNIKDLSEGGYGHGGGDTRLVNTLYDVLCGKSDNRTSLASSIESHLMGICAEESRLAGGKLVYVHPEKQ